MPGQTSLGQNFLADKWHNPLPEPFILSFEMLFFLHWLYDIVWGSQSTKSLFCACLWKAHKEDYFDVFFPPYLWEDTPQGGSGGWNTKQLK